MDDVFTCDIIGLLQVKFSDVVGSTSGSPDSTGWYWCLGVMLAMIGASLTVVGLILQKRAQNQSGDKGLGIITDGQWRFGIFVWLIGQLTALAANGLASRSILACFNCWNIVVIFVLAPIMVGEPVPSRAYLGAVLTLGGCIWVILSGPHEYEEQTEATISAAWRRQPFLIAVVASAAFLLVTMCAGCTGRLLGSGELAVASAVFAWYSVLQDKCLATLITTSIRTTNQVNHWQPWLYLTLMIVLVTIQMHVINIALRRGSTLGVLPLYEAVSMAGQVVIIGIFFQEFRLSSWGSMALFGGGLACTLLGVAIIRRSVLSDASEEARRHLGQSAAMQTCSGHG